jgi:hypothetical protein
MIVRLLSCKLNQGSFFQLKDISGTQCGIKFRGAKIGKIRTKKQKIPE